MIVKKLLAPLVNNKILQQAEYCYIASASISEQAFDLLMSKLPPKCPVDIVTGLDFPTHPNVLWKALKQYPDRVTLRIHTKSLFHSHAYIFDMPFRKRVAFLGSGDFTLEGIKDNEELFYKIELEKSVEELKSWFRSYFEYGHDLNEKMIRQYEEVYPSLVLRAKASQIEAQQIKEFITGRFRWESINFTSQYFKLEDFITFENSRVGLNNLLIVTERSLVKEKFVQLNQQLKTYLNKQKVYESSDPNLLVSSLDPIYHKEQKVKSMWLSYGRSAEELNQYKAKLEDMLHLRFVLDQYSFQIKLIVGEEFKGQEDRNYFQKEMEKEEYREKFLGLFKKLGSEYTIEIAGETRKIDSFTDEENLHSFCKADKKPYPFIIERSFSPGDPAFSTDAIVSTINGEFDKLIPLYQLMKDKNE
jgi:hypothetical protein